MISRLFFLSPKRQRGIRIPLLVRRAHLILLLLLVVLAACFVCAGSQAQQKIVARQRVWTDENFDQWVFQQDGNASGARRRLDSLLALQLEDIDRVCKLTDPQRHKLESAGRGDIKRFFDRYEKVKRKFQLIKQEEQKLQEIWPEISPLQRTLHAGLFYDDSLLYKSLHNTLTGQQFAGYDATARERRAFRHRANIHLAVAILEQGMPLREEQRRQLITLLMNQTKPPRRSGQYDYYLVMAQIGRVPEEKLKSLLDNTQWRVVNRQLDQFKAIEQSLKQSGQLANGEDEGDGTEDAPTHLEK
jgi:hypothetical protein